MYKENIIDLEQKTLFGDIYIDAAGKTAPAERAV
jgi:chromatin segregation and condensation protein Rec8/ScpA/Scc1 (kleisin family)